MLSGTCCSLRPTAIIMAGPPGSGKSKSLDDCIPLVHQHHGGPATFDEYAIINPDVWIGELCENNNAHRNVANYCNHETFSQYKL